MEPDAAWLEAHAELSRAISAYYEATSGEFVDGWVLVTHKLSVELEAEGSSAVSVISSPDLSWVKGRGLLEIARENPAYTGRQGE
ncbi:hypothetical protein [Leucobacter musarum]|uniref:hypothetical protein n=1 Tax=Leucobacter musarum TaxID=1930747 RepID=UPI0006A76BBC|nr:hypothetical protein [Leucobacter musarum]